MSSLLRAQFDTSALLAALDALEGEVLRKHLLGASAITAARVKSEAEMRVRRRTGRTARGIVVQEATAGTGHVVIATNTDEPGLPGWLEHGTEKMRATPFLFASARLEEGAHAARCREAVQDAIDEVGLGG